jgi:metal-responsive CopG/Arc/MetJ family transcriptional regulator
MVRVQITFDEGLLRRLDADPETRRLGRSAVLRIAVEEWLKGKRDKEIDEQIRRGYQRHPAAEFDEWLKEEPPWPDE